MIDPTLVAGVVGIVTIAGAAAYAKLTGNAAKAGVDLDDDGNDEIAAEFGGDDNNTIADVAQEQADPTPDAVVETDGLTDVKGIQETRASDLRAAGYETPKDLYYASDSNLQSVYGIGPKTVEQIRSDIGSVEKNSTE